MGKVIFVTFMLNGSSAGFGNFLSVLKFYQHQFLIATNALKNFNALMCSLTR